MRHAMRAAVLVLTGLSLAACVDYQEAPPPARPVVVSPPPAASGPVMVMPAPGAGPVVVSPRP